jgi:hypothetical protein
VQDDGFERPASSGHSIAAHPYRAGDPLYFVSKAGEVYADCASIDSRQSSSLQVSGPTCPSWASPWAAWKATTAALVAGPKIPSTGTPKSF